jgi:putative spermidine/putrescine transport system permease protein
MIKNFGFGRISLTTYAILMYGFIFAPIVVVIASSFTAERFSMFPPQGFSLEWYMDILNYPEIGTSILLSLYIAIVVTVASVMIGSVSAYFLSKHRFRGRDLLSSFMLMPIYLPHIILGLALLQFYTFYVRFGNVEGLIIGHVVITLPYVFRIIASNLVEFDKSYEEASYNLGAGPIRTFFRITLPIIKPALIAATLFTFILSFDNITISIFLTGPLFKTIPVVLWGMLFERMVDPTLAAISSLLVIISVIVFVLLSKFGKQIAIGGGG